MASRTAEDVNETTGSGGNSSDTKEEEKKDDKMFECNICLDTARDAVVSMCGHLFWYLICHCIKFSRKLRVFFQLALLTSVVGNAPKSPSLSRLQSGHKQRTGRPIVRQRQRQTGGPPREGAAQTGRPTNRSRVRIEFGW